MTRMTVHGVFGFTTSIFGHKTFQIFILSQCFGVQETTVAVADIYIDNRLFVASVGVLDGRGPFGQFFFLGGGGVV